MFPRIVQVSEKPETWQTLTYSINIDTMPMSDWTKILAKMRDNPGGIRFAELCKVADHYFGPPRQATGSHRVYRTPWAGDPRVNIQNEKGMAKAYQVRQLLKAIEKLEPEHGQGQQ